MHTIDGNVLRVAIFLLLAIGFDEKWKHILGYDAVFIDKIEKYLLSWRSNVTRDFARQPRSLHDIKDWKMRETHTAGVHLIPSLQAVPELAAYFGEEKRKKFFHAFMHLVTGIRLVYNFSHHALPKVCIESIREFKLKVINVYVHVFLIIF